MAAMAQPSNRAYMRLIRRFPLTPIHNHAQLDKALEMLGELMDKRPLCQDEQDYFDILADQIERYESVHFPQRQATPVEIISGLMEVNNLKQVDMIAYFGTKSAVSEFLSGKRQLSKQQIVKLSKHFCLSPKALLVG